MIPVPVMRNTLQAIGLGVVVYVVVTKLLEAAEQRRHTRALGDAMASALVELGHEVAQLREHVTGAHPCGCEEQPPDPPEPRP